MFFWKAKSLILSAEHSSVVQKPGSRGFVRGECANGKFINKNIKNETNIHPKINEKSMQNPCSKSDAEMMCQKGARRGANIYHNQSSRQRVQKIIQKIDAEQNRQKSRNDRPFGAQAVFFGWSGGRGGS